MAIKFHLSERCPTCFKFRERPNKAVYPNRYRYAVARIGLQVPEIEMQFAPLCWEIGFGFSREKLAACLGPLRVAIWFRLGGFVRDAESEWTARP